MVEGVQRPPAVAADIVYWVAEKIKFFAATLDLDTVPRSML